MVLVRGARKVGSHNLYNVYRYRNSWSMEEWLAFVETFSTFIF